MRRLAHYIGNPKTGAGKVKDNLEMGPWANPCWWTKCIELASKLERTEPTPFTQVSRKILYIVKVGGIYIEN